MKYLLTIIIVLFLTGCESIKFKNLAKTGATTAITYAVAGPIPAIVNLGTSVLVDEVLPAEETITDIESGNTEQMWAYIWKELMENILYAIIGLLVFTTVIGPWAVQRRARRKRKYDQYKYEAKLARENNVR